MAGSLEERLDPLDVDFSMGWEVRETVGMGGPGSDILGSTVETEPLMADGVDDCFLSVLLGEGSLVAAGVDDDDDDNDDDVWLIWPSRWLPFWSFWAMVEKKGGGRVESR